jgi:hypothetical protein
MPPDWLPHFPVDLSASNLGRAVAFAGLGWVTYRSTLLVNNLSPYNLASGPLGEGLVMLWLLVNALDAQKWNELATARRVSRILDATPPTTALQAMQRIFRRILGQAR